MLLKESVRVMLLKENVCVILLKESVLVMLLKETSSDPPWKTKNTRLTKVPLNAHV